MSGHERLTSLALFVLLLICYGYFFPRWADPNQNSRLDMVVAVVDGGTFQIDRYVHNTVDYAKVGQHYYSDKAPGVALLGIPVYAGLKVILDQPIMGGLTDRLANSLAFQATLRSDGTGVVKDKVRFALAQVVLTFVIITLPSALLGVLMFRLLSHFTPSLWARLGVVLGYTLLTPVFAYAGAFYGHQLSAVLLFAAFYLLFRPARPLSTKALLLAGALLGASVVVEYPSVLIVAILFTYAFYLLRQVGHSRQIVWVALAGGIIAAGWMEYNKSIFGGLLALGYSNSELWLTQHETGFLSLTWPHVDAIWGITFGIFRGLFVLSPWLLLSVPGFVLWWRSHEQRPAFWVSLLSVLAFFWFNASSIMWWGGFSVGPRYLLPALPFLVVPIYFAWRAWGRLLWMRVAIVVLAAWSFLATWGLTLANQAFPSDTIANPFVAYAWPSWIAGNIARNYGTLLGLHGLSSLIPLAVSISLLSVVWGLASRRLRDPAAHIMPANISPARSEATRDGYAGTRLS